MAKKNIATFLGTQKGLSTLGDHAYAFSGLITVTGDDTVLLDFMTSSRYIVTTFIPVYATDAGDNAEWEIEINGEIVYVLFATAATISALTQDVRIIFPPNSRIRVLGSVGNDRVLGAIISGRVYDA